MAFNDFMSQLSETNSTLNFFVDYKKVIRNINRISIKLNQLNYLIGKDNLEEAIRELYIENQKCFSALNILIAVRDNKKVINSIGETVDLNSYFQDVGSIIQYFNETGLSEIFKKKNIKNLVDYVFGIEVGLDTNARKNRGGTNMEELISSIFSKNNISFEREVKNTIFPDLKALGKDVKRFDFVIKTERKIYLIETNYYNRGGSKLNETARAYTDIAPKINSSENYEFVWITDGQGWHSARNKLEEAYNNISRIYNIATLSKFINEIKNGNGSL